MRPHAVGVLLVHDAVIVPQQGWNFLMQQASRWVRALRGRIDCLRALATARRDSLARLGEAEISRVLVVCYGNIYRSAFVEAYLARKPLAGVEVRSAGLHPAAGRESPSRHIAMSLAHGVDLGRHRSRVLEADDLRWAQLIILMDRHNWQALIQRDANPKRLVWLGALDGGGIEIPDPYELQDAQAECIVARLDRCSRALAASLASPVDPTRND